MGRSYKFIGHRTTDIRHLISLALVNFFTASKSAGFPGINEIPAVIHRRYSASVSSIVQQPVRGVRFSIVGIVPLCYYGYVRRFLLLIWAVVICAVVFLAACGHKTAQVKAPQPAPVVSKDLECLAWYYAEPYHGRRTASGEIFDSYRGLTAAHRTLPFNTLVRVTNKTNGREVDVKINDRGPFVDGRVIDLSVRAARQIDLVRAGVAPVKLKILKEGSVAPAAVSVSGKALFAVQVGAFENQRAAE